MWCILGGRDLVYNSSVMNSNLIIGYICMYVNVVADSVMLQYTYEMNLITNFKIKHKFFMLPQDLSPPPPQ